MNILYYNYAVYYNCLACVDRNWYRDLFIDWDLAV